MTNINFPDDPSDGDRVGLQVYDATRGVWEWDALPGDTTAEDLLGPGQVIAYSNIEYLVVAGGGAGGGSGGGNQRSGGGGAGGYISGTTSLALGSYSIEVGAGGSAYVPNSTRSGNGSNTVFNNLTAIGGGGGACMQPNVTGASGGSGGGGGSDPSGAGTGTPGQGNAGGAGGGYNQWGGGGGGAGAAGFSRYNSPNGGDGLSSSITGSTIFYAGGGAGVPGSGTTVGGAGGGGNYPAGNGSENLGGGGGAENNNTSGSTGGSGVVIIKLPSSANTSFSVGLTEANGGSGQTVGDYKVYTVTAGTGTVTIS